MRALAKEIISLLTKKGQTLSVAESFTGGGVVQELVSVPGASAVIYEGAVCYSERAKISRLGVKAETLETFGAVSKQTALEMVQGLMQTGACNYAVSTTGNAGPTPSGKAPVGAFYIGVASPIQTTVFEHVTNGDRQRITKEGIRLALTHLLNEIKKQ
ncbi:MAG: CinA family protein [Clostridiales bacterium]|nr:CinA family protein [Clostridiales bacterium]